MTRHPFTFIELLVVCVVIGLLSALVVPRIGGASRRMVAEQALLELHGAFGQTALRARAGGRPLMLVLEPEEGRAFSVQPLTESLTHDWRPPALVSESVGEEAPKTGIFAAEDTYKVADAIEWIDLPEVPDDAPGIVFSFYPDGAAAGPELRFTLAGGEYLLRVDAITGQATIAELPQR